MVVVTQQIEVREFGDLDFSVGNLFGLLKPRTAAGRGAVVAWYSLVHLAGSGRFAAKPPSDHNMVRVSLYLP